MKPTLTRTFAKDYTDPVKGRLAVTLNAWLPAEIDSTEEELRPPLEQCLSTLERTLFHIQAPDPPKPKRCHQCHFWTVWDNQERESADRRDCRRRAPLAFVRAIEFQGTTISTTSHFPQTQRDEYCGDFERFTPENADRPSGQ